LPQRRAALTQLEKRAAPAPHVKTLNGLQGQSRTQSHCLATITRGETRNKSNKIVLLSAAAG
jgi:hypothetical protein